MRGGSNNRFLPVEKVTTVHPCYTHDTDLDYLDVTFKVGKRFNSKTWTQEDAARNSKTNTTATSAKDSLRKPHYKSFITIENWKNNKKSHPN